MFFYCVSPCLFLYNYDHMSVFVICVRVCITVCKYTYNHIYGFLYVFIYSKSLLETCVWFRDIKDFSGD